MVQATTMSDRLIMPRQIKPLNIMGTPTTILLSEVDTNGAYSLFDIRADQGLGVPLHTHSREDEMFYVLAGQVRFTIEDRQLVAGPGTTIYSPRGQRHAWFGASAEQAHFLVTATPSGMENMFKELDQLPPGAPDIAKVTAICARYGINFM